jgi:hypothetical protein
MLNREEDDDARIRSTKRLAEETRWSWTNKSIPVWPVQPLKPFHEGLYRTRVAAMSTRRGEDTVSTSDSTDHHQVLVAYVTRRIVKRASLS